MITILPKFEKYYLPLLIMKEIMSVFEGIKPAMTTGSEIYKPVFKFVKDEAPGHDVRLVKRNDYLGREGFTANILYVAKKEIIEKIIEAERASDHMLIGKYLGYPECCRKKIIENDNRAPKISEIYKATKGSPNGLLNDVFVFESRLEDPNDATGKNAVSIGILQDYGIISHIPCSYACRDSIVMAKRIAGIYKKIVDPESWLFVKSLLFSTILFIDKFNFLMVKSSERNSKTLKGKILMVSPWLAEKPFYDKLSVSQIVTYDFMRKELFEESSKKSKSVSMEVFSFE